MPTFIQVGQHHVNVEHIVSISQSNIGCTVRLTTGESINTDDSTDDIFWKLEESR